MINSSKTEYAFWKLKILNRSGGGEERCELKSLGPTSLIRKPVRKRGGVEDLVCIGKGGRAHVPEIPIQDFDVTMNDLQRREFVISRRDPAHEEEGSVSPINDLCI